MTNNRKDEETPVRDKARLARVILFSFLLVFVTVRILVFLIMSQRLPDLYLHLGGTHIHHLNYGILLLSGLGAYLLFRRPEGRALTVAAVLYGIGLALTFDEFGMWLRLGGGYWQQASWDAVGVLAALFGLVGYAPALKQFRPRHWWSTVLAIGLVLVFFVMLADSCRHVRNIVGPRLYELEAASPP